MNSLDIYNKLRPYFPKEVQFVEPYLDNVSLPEGDFAIIHVVSFINLGYPQHRQIADEGGNLTMENNQLQVVNTQIDFFGPHSFENATELNLRMRTELIKKHENDFSLKVANNVEDRTQLMDNKLYMKRYGFDASFFNVVSYVNETTAIEHIEAKNIYIANQPIGA